MLVFARVCDMEGKYGPHNFIIQSRDPLLALSLVEQISLCGFQGLGLSPKAVEIRNKGLIAFRKEIWTK